MLSGDFDILARKPGDVPAGMGQIGNDAGLESGSDRTHNDRDRPGRFLGSERCRRAPGNDQIDLERDEFGGQGAITGVVAFGPPIGELDVLSLAPAEVAQTFAEAVDGLERSRGENADALRLGRLLSGKSRCDGRRGTRQKNAAAGPPAAHSMTSPARASGRI